MASKFISKRNLKFMLHEVLDVASLTTYDYYKQHNAKMFDMVVDEAIKMAKNLMLPNLKDMDMHPPELVDGIVKVHPSIRTVMKECGEGGWIASSFSTEHGGEQLPMTLSNLSRYIFAAANYSACVYADLCAGAAHLIISFGTKELFDTYVPNILAGKWQGTMALTEPQAGSSLTDITTTAYPLVKDPADDSGNGVYKIQGQKIFISAGDHNAVENVVHLMLAKIEGAPAGIKGISLFVVPKKRIAADGSLVSNDLTVTQIYHKLGYKGTPLTELSIGEQNDCHGYLVGEPHKGLKYMFQMMNEARLEVGLGAAGIASAAYHAALEYAKDRPQGRRIGEKNPDLPQMSIIEHADVKRMLLFQRAVVEGSLALLMQCCMYADLEIVSEGEDKEKYSLLLDILTPVAKTFPSEMGVLSVSSSMQCLGGYGYCDDFPIEQYYRDIRIHPIHEGTTGMQGMDLLGRKVVMKGGKAAALFFEEVQKAINAADNIKSLHIYAARLKEALETLQTVTMHLIGIAQEKGPETYLADASVYLQLFGTITIAWQWFVQALAAQKALDKNLSEKESNFYQGKIFTFKYFFRYELVQISGLAKRLMDNDPLTVEMKRDFF
jgi:butyryl-CoA dehydrogenase